MTTFSKAFLFLLFVGIFSVGVTPSAQADPLFFSNVVALQNNNSTQVDLFSHPGVTLLGPQVNFLVDITGTLPPNVTNTLVVTFTESGRAPIIQTFDIPAFGTIPPPLTFLVTFSALGATTQGTSATLTFDIVGSSPDFIIPGGQAVGSRVDSYSYSFQVAEPVPEPSTLIIFSTGIIGLARKIGKRRRRRQT